MIHFAAARPMSSFLRRVRFAATVCLFAFATALMLAQTAGSGGSLQGTITDGKGGGLPQVAVSIKNDASGNIFTARTDGEGHYTATNLPAGSYTVSAAASGFAVVTKKAIVTSTGPASVDLALTIGSATSDITVEADATGSIAASLAPMDALLDATSARTEITSAMIQNFMSPVADYGEAVQLAPATFSLNGNGVGLGQAKIYFRGFPDGEYDIKFDGIPWSDTNSVSHHTWAFFPTQFLGGIDFDRSPGTASTVGFAPFGGSINLLSKDMSPVQNIRATFAGGSYNTYLYDLEYDSGPFGPGKKLSTNIDVHHMQSHGYQTGNNQTRNAGALKMVYALSPKTTITGFSGVIWLDSNTPNFAATRCQMYGPSTANATTTCVLAGTPTGLLPYTGAGINFLLTNNADPELYLDDQYNFYHVPTDFEYVGVHKVFGKGFVLDFKPYTYNYDNSEKYSNAVPIVDGTAAIGTTYAPLGVTITKNNLCSTQVVTTKKGNTVVAEPCSVDKYNSYRQYGETSELTQTSRLGILRAGMWYNWGNTNRHQYPTNPLNNYLDQPLPNFKEMFVQDSYQPYIEYQVHAGSKLNITPGVKFSYFTIATKQYADNGSTIGCLVVGCNLATNANINVNAFITNSGSYYATLPSAVANYHIKNNWTAYVQYAQGTIAPPSSVFDFQQTMLGVTLAPAALPKQQRNRTIQTGTAFKMKRVTFDADYYHIKFDNSYSSTLNSAGEPVYFAQPASITQGLEGESNIYLAHGISVYLNASYDKATYTGTISATCTGTTAVCAAAGPLVVSAPAGLNVQQTPSDVETEGITYQHKAYDMGFFNKRVGTFYIDNGSYHNQATIAPFEFADLFLNYTIHSSGRFDQTKIKVSFNNIFNSHNQTGESIKGTANTITLAANGTTYTDPFNTVGQTPINGGDAITILPGRSIMVAVTFGYNPKHGK